MEKIKNTANADNHEGPIEPYIAIHEPTGEATSEINSAPHDHTTVESAPRIRRMTYQDRLDVYTDSMEAYAQWQANGSPGGIYRIPKHPDEVDREYQERLERAEQERRKRRHGVRLIAGHILLPR